MSAQFLDLKDKNFFITGATRGIGHAIALELAKQGSGIYFNSRKNVEEIKKLESNFRDAGASSAKGVLFDINDFETMKKELNLLTSQGVCLSGLVCNAGVSKDQLIMKIKPDDLDFTLDTNLKSTILLCSHLSRHFLRQKDVSIVLMSSVVGLMGNTSQSAYSASKAGLVGLGKSMARELGSRKIRTNMICPGFIETEMTENLAEKTQDHYKESIPLGEFGKPEDVANLTCFLLSNTSRYITGEVIKVDGGLYT